MKPRTRSRWILLTLCLACIATGVWLARIHISTRSTTQALQRVTKENQQRTHEIDILRQSLASTSAADSSATRLSPEQRILQARYALIPQLKEARLTASPPPPKPPRDPSGPGGDHFPELMSDPEYASLTTRLWRHGTRNQWVYEFRYAGIPPEKQDQLRALLLEFGFSGDDAALTARRAGASEKQSWLARWQAAQEVSAEITALIGTDAHDKIQQAQRAQGAEELVERIETRLSYSGTPLTSSQVSQIFQLGVAHNIDRIVSDSTTFPALIEKAQGFLTHDQLNALREIAAEFNGGKSQKIVPDPAAP